MRVRVQVLGTVAVSRDGAVVAISSPSQRIVLSVLAAHPNSNVSVDVLVDALWPDDPPRTALRSLRTYVSRLRHEVGDVVAGAPGGYRLELDEDGIDHTRFERLVDDASAATAPAAALALLDQAFELWNGPPFGDVGDVDAIRSVTARLEERWVAAREARVAALLSSGRAADAVAAAEELVADHPLRERVWVSLVDALTATARPTEALRAYQRAVDTLADAGLEPTGELRRAEAAAFEGDVTPPLVRQSVGPPVSSFIGRAHDRSAVAEQIVHWPVVTLVGPGGVGKTRLARVVAADLEHRFSAGARIVQLAGIEDSAQVPAVIADRLELTIGLDGAMGALAAASDLDVLVLIDNCEHVAAAAAAAIEALTSGGGRLRVMATSREALSIDGERLWPVAPLSVEGPDGAAQLFIDRVVAVRPGFAPDEEERRSIEAIVKSLDGLPLAVEMAAAASRAMSVQTLTARLATEVQLPAFTRRDLDQRQRTLKDLVDWSLRLLDDEARSLFASMAVFAGSARATDVAEVSGHPAPFDALCRLADHSLLTVDAAGDEASFGMLRTIRQRASDLLADDIDALRARHAAWIVDSVVAADQQLRGLDERRAHDRIEALLDDARSAVVWTREHDPHRAARLAGHLYLFGQSRLRDEILAWSEAISEEIGDELAGPDGELVLTAAAQRAVNMGEIERAGALARRAIELNASTATPLAYEVLSDVHLFSGDAEQATVAAKAGLAASIEFDDTHSVVVSLVNLVLASAYGGDHADALRTMPEFPDQTELAPSDVAWIHYVEGERLLDKDPEPALAALARAIDIADDVGNAYIAAVSRVSYASLLSRTGEPAAARTPFAALLAHWRGQGDRTHLLTTLRNLVISLDRMRLEEQAAELLGTVLDDTVIPTFGNERDMLEHVRDRLAQRLGRNELERLMQVGRARTVDDAARVAETWLSQPPTDTVTTPEEGTRMR